MAKEILYNFLNAKWSEQLITEKTTLSYETVDSLGCLKTPHKYNDWIVEKAKFVEVADGRCKILGRDLFDKLRIGITQQPFSQRHFNCVNNQSPIRKKLAEELPGFKNSTEK